MSGPQLKHAEVERLRVLFEHYDVNADGLLDHVEFRVLLKDSFPYATDKELAEMTPMDEGEGTTKINFAEYINFMAEDTSLRFQGRFVKDQRSLWEDKLGLWLYMVFFAFFLYFLVEGGGSRGDYWTSSAVTRHLEEDHFQNADDLRYKKIYKDIGEVEEYWQWQLWPMVNTIWDEKSPDSQGYTPINGADFPIGALKITQVRVEAETCGSSVQRIMDHNQDTIGYSSEQITARKQQFRLKCYPEYSITNEANSAWVAQQSTSGTQVDLLKEHVISQFDRDEVFAAYEYRSSSALNASTSSHFMGKVTTYLSGGGYAVVLPFSYTRSKVLQILKTLEVGVLAGGWVNPDSNATGPAAAHPNINIPWIDQGTRGLQLEFYTYNQNTDLMGRFQDFIEFTASGQVLPLHYTHTFRFFDIGQHGAGYFLLVVIFCSMILVQCAAWLIYVVRTTKLKVLESGHQGVIQHIIEGWGVIFYDFWTPFDFLNLALFCAAWGLRFYIMTLAFTSTSVLETAAYPRGYDRVAELTVIVNSLDAFNGFLTFVRIFYYLRLNPRLNVLTATIGKAKVQLLGIMFIFVIVFIGFSLMAHVVFGTHLEEYRDLPTTISSLLRMLLGDFDYETLKEERRIFAPLLFVIFNVIGNFLLLNMVIAVLNQAFTNIRSEKYNPSTIEILLKTLDAQEHNQDQRTGFTDKITVRHKGLQHYIRGSSLWRELVYAANMVGLYATSKENLSGGEAEWNLKHREISDYNPRTFWRSEEERLYYTKRSIVFKDRLLCSPLPLKFYLLEQFGKDLKHVIDVSPVNSGYHEIPELRKHDLIVAPAYHLGINPRHLLVEMMDHFYTWQREHASAYATLEEELDGSQEVAFDSENPQGLAIRGGVNVERLIQAEIDEWWGICQLGAAAAEAKEDAERAVGTQPQILGMQRHNSADLGDTVGTLQQEEEQTKFERQRRALERDNLEQAYERKRLDDQHQYISNLQHAIDDLHAPISGKMTDGAFKITAADIHVPTLFTISGCPFDSYDPNGDYALKGLHNARPYWRKIKQDPNEPKLCILWGDGRWWVGSPRTRTMDRTCVPSMLSWHDDASRYPSKGYSTATLDTPLTGGADRADTAQGVWETVVDGGNGGIGDPPTLDYTVGPDGVVKVISVSGASSHPVNGQYTLQTLMENGKHVWRKRYQVVCRSFKVEPLPDEREKTSRIRAKLRSIRDEIYERYHVTLRVPGERAAPERRMQLEGDWHMVMVAYTDIINVARTVYANGADCSHIAQDTILSEVFFDETGEVDEALRVKKVAAVVATTQPYEWETVNKGYDLDLSWKAGRWVISKRLAKSNRGFIGFHEQPPKVSCLLYVKTATGAKETSPNGMLAQRTKWEKVIKRIPHLMNRYATPDELPNSSQRKAYMKPVARVPAPAAAGQVVERFFEGNVSWYKERRPGGGGGHGEDAMLFGVSFVDQFPNKDRSSAEVLMDAGSIKGTWVECTIVDEPDETGPNARYRVSINFSATLPQNALVAHKEYFAKHRTSRQRTIFVTRDRLRKRPGQDAESWVTRFVSWVNDPTHMLHSDFPGLIAATKQLNPAPQILYCCNDPDTRHHPPLFPTTWKMNNNEICTDVKFLATTKTYIKKVGLGGLDTTPLYLGLHHAYVKEFFVFQGDEAPVFRPPKAYYRKHGTLPAQGEEETGADMLAERDPTPLPSFLSRKGGDIVCGSTVVFQKKSRYSHASMRSLTSRSDRPDTKTKEGKEYIELFDGVTGIKLNLWVEKTSEWVVSHDLQLKWTSDKKDAETMYPCCHKWKNEASIWEVERAPRRGVHFFIKKPAYVAPLLAQGSKQETMAATNYPLSYKGDSVVRYLTADVADARETPDTADPAVRATTQMASMGLGAGGGGGGGGGEADAPLHSALHSRSVSPASPSSGQRRATIAPPPTERDFTSYMITAKERTTAPCMWCVQHYPKDLPDIRDRRNRHAYSGGNRTWWQAYSCILDWVRHDKNRVYDEASILSSAFVPTGLKWSAANEAVLTSNVWQPAPPAEILSRIEWYLNHWRLARLDVAHYESIDDNDDSLTKAEKISLQELLLIDAERAKDTHRVLIRTSPENGLATNVDAFLSLWRSFPVVDFQGVWRTRAFLTTSGDEYYRVESHGVGGLAGYMIEGEHDIGTGDVAFKLVMLPSIGGAGILGELCYHEQTLDCFLEAKSYTEIHITVARWEEEGLDSLFILHRTDALKRDDESHYVIATREFDFFTNNTWEIETIHDLGQSIDTAVETAVVAQQYGLQEQFKALIHDEMKYLLCTIIPNVLVEELGPGQLVQTLNYKIHSDAVDKEDRAKRGITETDEARQNERAVTKRKSVAHAEEWKRAFDVTSPSLGGVVRDGGSFSLNSTAHSKSTSGSNSKLDFSGRWGQDGHPLQSLKSMCLNVTNITTMPSIYRGKSSVHLSADASIPVRTASTSSSDDEDSEIVAGEIQIPAVPAKSSNARLDASQSVVSASGNSSLNPVTLNTDLDSSLHAESAAHPLRPPTIVDTTLPPALVKKEAAQSDTASFGTPRSSEQEMNEK